MTKRHQALCFSAFFSIILLASSPFAMADDETKKWDVTTPTDKTVEVNIDVTNGTWMSVDVSSDGKWLTFDLLGDIYVMSSEGGEAKNIAPGFAWDMQPRFSPDGQKIAFTSDRAGGDNLWIMDVDGSNPKQISKENFRLLNSPNWSPDGQYIIGRKHFTTTRSAGTGEVWMYNIDGGDGVAIVERPNPTHQKDLGEPVYSPDGQYIYYSLDSTSGGGFVYAQDSNGQIYEIKRINLNTGETEDIINGVGGSVRPTPSPDGKHVAFIRRIRTKSALYVKDLVSGKETMLYADMDHDLQETWAIQGTYPGMDWTPDGKEIVFWAGGKIHKINATTKALSNIPFHVKDTRITEPAPRPIVDVAPQNFHTKMVRWASFSPDGSNVIYEALGKIYIQKTSGGAAKRLTSDKGEQFELYPSFSADGKQVAFITWDDTKLGTIQTVSVRGGRSKTITNEPGQYVEPRFSPDGKTIVFRKRSGGYLLSDEWSVETGIFTMPSNGGAAKLVSKSGYGAHFGKSNDRVYFTDGREGGTHLISTDLIGNDERDLLVSEFGREFMISPNEKWVTWLENYQTFVAPFTALPNSLTVSTSSGGMPVVRLSKDGGTYHGFSAGGNKAYWSLGPTVFSADLGTILNSGDDAYKAPSEGIALGFEAKADKPNTKLALMGANIITMNKDREVIKGGTILVDDNRIIAVGSFEEVEIPSGYVKIDMAGKTIIPGLIDAHAHGSQGSADIIPQQNWENFGHLALGVTTIHDPSNRSEEIFSASEYQRSGLVLAPRIYSTGTIVYGAKAPDYWAQINSYDDALSHVKRLKAQGAMSIKNYNQPRREQRQQVAQAARDENMLVVSEGGAQYSMDLSMVADGDSSIEHTLPITKVYDDVLQFWSATNVAQTMTFVVNYGGLAGENYYYQKDEVWKHPILANFVPAHIIQPRAVRREMAPDEDYVFKDIAKTAKKFSDAGITINTGGHGQREGLGTHWEMWLYAQGGASPMEALQAATINPATHLGMNADLGSLEVGKLADLVVLNANPLEDIRNTDHIDQIMLNGRLYDAQTLDEKITGSRKTKPFYWSGRAQAKAR